MVLKRLWQCSNLLLLSVFLSWRGGGTDERRREASGWGWEGYFFFCQESGIIQGTLFRPLGGRGLRV